MCGVPYHSSEAYIARLIEKGYKVAICEQNENAKDEDGLVAREVIRIITPGTVVESSMLQNEKNNYICTIYIDALGCGMCFADITTGEVDALEITSGEIDIQIMTEIGKYLPREVIMNISAEENPRIVDYIGARMHTMLAAAGLSCLTNIRRRRRWRSSLKPRALNRSASRTRGGSSARSARCSLTCA